MSIMAGGKRDFYKVLGVHQTSSLEEIQKAYRAASKRYHPDLNRDLKFFSEDKMRELVEAFEVLSDVDKRKEYDRQPHFQLRKSRRTETAVDPKLFSRSQAPKKESFFKKIFSCFSKKKKGDVKSERNAKEADVHFMLGLSMAQSEGFYDDAIAEFRESVKYDSEYMEAFWNLGILCYRKGLFDEAVINFQKVLTLKKEDAAAAKVLMLLREN